MLLHHTAKKANSLAVRVARNASREKHKKSDRPVGMSDLTAAGWSIRSAARELGCSAGHLCRHLKGERPSARLQARLENLLQDKP